MLLLLLHCYCIIIIYYYIIHYYVLLLYLLLHCYYIIITYYYIFIITYYYNIIITYYYIIITSLLHHYYIIITSLLLHYSQLQKQVIMSSLLHIMHYSCFGYYIVIIHYYHSNYCPFLHVTNWATCRCTHQEHLSRLPGAQCIWTLFVQVACRRWQALKIHSGCS